jgi:hypothetical protein
MGHVFQSRKNFDEMKRVRGRLGWGKESLESHHSLYDEYGNHLRVPTFSELDPEHRRATGLAEARTVEMPGED